MEKPTKKDLTCAFHEDFENSVCSIKKRVNVIVYFVIINALLTGGHLVLRLPTLF